MMPIRKFFSTFLKRTGLSKLQRKNVNKGLHCIKSVRIRSYSGPHFSAFGLNNSEYGHFSRSCDDYKKIFFVNFKTSLGNVLRHCSTDFRVFEYIFTSVLNEYALKKKRKSFG